MQKLVIDTSVIIDYLRQKDKEKTLLFYCLQNNYEICISIVAHTESYAGKSIWERKEAKHTLDTLFLNLHILPLKKGVSQKAGLLRATYNLDIIDAIIAATTMDIETQLATFNVKDFQPIKGLKIFKK